MSPDPFTGEERTDTDAKRKRKRADENVPPVPEAGQDERICAWLTGALRLDPEHPVAGGKHGGLAGESGHVSLRRLGARPIRFEPMSCLCTVGKLRTAIMCQRVATDKEPPTVTQAFCDKVTLAVNRLCDHTAVIGANAETIGIIAAFLHAAEPVYGQTTYGGSRERYQAAVALRRAWTDGLQSDQRGGPALYLVESDPEHAGEIAIGVGDLQAAARRVTGTGHRHGWLDGRIDDIGWERFTLQGWREPGRAGRREPGGHAGVEVYRGQPPADPQAPDEPDETAEVNT